MASHLESQTTENCSAFGDLAALFCRGGLVVQTPGPPDAGLVRSTIQLDGDMTVCVTRPGLHHRSLLSSHLGQVEERLQRATRLIRGTLWVAHSTIVAVVFAAWFVALREGPELADRLSMAAVWIGCSIASAAIVECLLQSSFVRKSILSSIVNGLSRFAGE